MLFNDPMDLLRPDNLKSLHTQLLGLVRGQLWLQVSVAMVLGVATGMALGPSTGWVAPELAHSLGDWLALPGRLFLSLIQMVVIPLVVASIIQGLAASESMEQLRGMGLRVLAYFILTTAVAVAVGLIAAGLIRPGAYIDSAAVQASLATPAPMPLPQSDQGVDLGRLPERIAGLLPSNPLNAMLTANMIQVVVFALIFGVALMMLPDSQSRPLLDLSASLLQVCMTIVRWAMWLAPLAVFGLLAQLTARIGLDALLGMGVYVLTVLAGLLVMLALYLTLVLLVARRSPLWFLRGVSSPLVLAFSTSSSAAVMPLSIQAAEENLGVRASVSRFVIPLATTINMNGTALYQGVATLFLAQVFGVEIGLSSMLLIVLVAVGAAIGSPAIPGVGIVILAMVLTSVGVPAAGIALILGVDRILDMSRTAINVAGDLVACVLMEHWQETRHHAGVIIEATAQPD